MDTHEETIVVKLAGGPMDGHEIEVKPSSRAIIPGPHHRRDAGCKGIPVYVKAVDQQYRFSHYKSTPTT